MVEGISNWLTTNQVTLDVGRGIFHCLAFLKSIGGLCLFAKLVFIFQTLINRAQLVISPSEHMKQKQQVEVEKRKRLSVNHRAQLDELCLTHEEWQKSQNQKLLVSNYVICHILK